MSLADSPPERALVGLSASSPLKSIWPISPRSFLCLIGAGIELPEPVDGGHTFGDRIAVILREVPDGDFVSPDYRAAIDGKFAIGIFDEPGGIAHNDFSRWSAGTVAAHESDLFAARDAGEKRGITFRPS